MVWALLGCSQMDELRAENARLEEENAQLVEELVELREQVDACATVTALEASAARNFDPPPERCVDFAYSGDLELLSGSGMTRDMRVLPAPKGGLRLLSIRRDSLANSCGFENGDVLIQVDGEAIQGLDDWEPPEPPGVAFTVIRRGQETTWELAL